MKDEEKHIIEELASDIYSLKSCDTSFEENCKLLAYDLVTLGWVKLTEDSFVLTNDNAEELANLIVTSPQMQSVMSDLIKAWQKETAEKILKFVLNMAYFDLDGRLTFPVNLLRNYIANKLNIEIKE